MKVKDIDEGYRRIELGSEERYEVDGDMGESGTIMPGLRHEMGGGEHAGELAWWVMFRNLGASGFLG